MTAVTGDYQITVLSSVVPLTMKSLKVITPQQFAVNATLSNPVYSVGSQVSGIITVMYAPEVL
jgi:hypothetical protein